MPYPPGQATAQLSAHNDRRDASTRWSPTAKCSRIAGGQEIAIAGSEYGKSQVGRQSWDWSTTSSMLWFKAAGDAVRRYSLACRRNNDCGVPYASRRGGHPSRGRVYHAVL